MIPNPRSALRFPEGFLWGSATASHQVEGWNHLNDWWVHEQAGRLPFQSGAACEQLQRYRTISSSCASLVTMPTDSRWSGVALSRASASSITMPSNTIAASWRAFEPMAWSPSSPSIISPVPPGWLAAAVGLARPRPELFARYTRQVVSALKDIVRYWITINEPTVYTFQGYVFGVWPPHRYDPVHGIRVMRTMALAHGRAYHAIHELQPDAQVGVAHHWRVFDPPDPGNAGDMRVASMRDWLNNRWFPLAIQTGKLLPPLGRGRKIDWLAQTEDWVGDQLLHA